MTDRIALFIDGPNNYAATKALGFDLDFKPLLAHFKDGEALVRAYYYSAVVDDEYSSIRPLLDWLDYNGYSVVTKTAKEFVDSSGRRKVKGNMDIELAVDAMELAEHIDKAVIFSGDGDFKPLVAGLQRAGVRVVVVSTIQVQPSFAADELRRQADEFIDLNDLPQHIRKPIDRTSWKDRPERVSQERSERVRECQPQSIPT